MRCDVMRSNRILYIITIAIAFSAYPFSLVDVILLLVIQLLNDPKRSHQLDLTGFSNKKGVGFFSDEVMVRLLGRNFTPCTAQTIAFPKNISNSNFERWKFSEVVRNFREADDVF